MKYRKGIIKKSILCLSLLVMSLFLTGCQSLVESATNTIKGIYDNYQAKETINNYSSEEKEIYNWIKANIVDWKTFKEYTDAQAVSATKEVMTMIETIKNDYGRSTFYDFQDNSIYVDKVEFVSYEPDFHPGMVAVGENNANITINVKCSDGITYNGINVLMNDDGKTVDTSKVYEKAIVAAYATQYVKEELLSILNTSKTNDYTIYTYVTLNDFNVQVNDIFLYENKCSDNLLNKRPLEDFSELDNCIYLDLTININNSKIKRKTPDEVMDELNRWKDEHQLSGEFKLNVTYSSEDTNET